MRNSIMNNKKAVAEAIAKSNSIKEVLENLGLRAAGGNYAALHKAVQKHQLILPQWDRASQIRSLGVENKLPDAVIFVENSTYINRKNIKKRLYSIGVPEKCNSCGVGNFWNGKPLTLTLEHKNGIWNDNRIENLEILCPNCHSQTPTFCGKNK